MERLGKYVVEGTLGEGGMGMVYQALDPVIGRRVAIKVIHRHAMSEGNRARFVREAQSVGRLMHENITTLFDVGEQDGDPFLVFEYLGGMDLRQRLLAAPPLTLDEKLDVAVQICRGLAYAHLYDVIHRDVKPDNVRVMSHGRVKIMDFGLARAETDTLTQFGMGTPRYMSPEQIKGEVVDHRTDVFSFGVLLYEMLSGVNPFFGDHLSTVVYRIVHEEPEPPRLEAGELGDGLQQIVARCIAKDPDARYADFDAVLTDLAALRSHAPTVCVGPAGRWTVEAVVDRAPSARCRPVVPPAMTFSAVLLVAYLLAWGGGHASPVESVPPVPAAMAAPPLAPSAALDETRPDEEVPAPVEVPTVPAEISPSPASPRAVAALDSSVAAALTLTPAPPAIIPVAEQRRRAPLPVLRGEVDPVLRRLVRHFKNSLEAEDVEALRALHPFFAERTGAHFFDGMDAVEAHVDYVLGKVSTEEVTAAVSLQVVYLEDGVRRRQQQTAFTWHLGRDVLRRWVLRDVVPR